jgi:hypothetical protein
MNSPFEMEDSMRRMKKEMAVGQSKFRLKRLEEGWKADGNPADLVDGALGEWLGSAKIGWFRFLEKPESKTPRAKPAHGAPKFNSINGIWANRGVEQKRRKRRM